MLNDVRKCVVVAIGFTVEHKRFIKWLLVSEKCEVGCVFKMFPHTERNFGVENTDRRNDSMQWQR